MIRYTLPGMTEFTDLLTFFIQVRAAHPDMFYEDVEIDSVYGGFLGSRLCGGRSSAGEQYDVGQIAALIARYNEAGVACNATFSNQFATAQTLENSEYDDAVLAALANGSGNGVIVYSDELADAIRAKYPQLRLIASTTKTLDTAQKIAEALERYDRAVLDYNHTTDAELIARVAQPGRLEAMVNEYCTPGCPYRHEHYAEISRAQLAGEQSSFACKHDPSPQAYGFLQGLIEGDVFLKNADVRKMHDEFGIEHFKIVGRGLERYDIVDSLLYYLVQLDCWYEIRDFLVRHDYL